MSVKSNIKSCYIHIPFCNEICSYCDFCKMYYNDELINKYLNALEKEIEEIYKGEELETIYIGGGTPSSLNTKQLIKLFNIINKLNKKDDCSITIENNFESITKEKLDIYRNNNINRLSFGIETTNKKLLKLLNRDIDKKKIKDIINYSKSIGIKDINLDLIYAIPNETIKDVEKDLEFILSLEPTHISTYSLILEEHTLLFINKYKNIDDELDYSMYEEISKILKEHKYNHYEISNFSIRGYESKHNLTYWNNEHFYGFGLGAASYIDNNRILNTRSINNYIKGKRVVEKEKLSKEDEINYQIILNLRLQKGINKTIFKNKYQIKLEDYINYKDLVDNNLLIETKNNLYIPEDKLYISNSIIEKLLIK